MFEFLGAGASQFDDDLFFFVKYLMGGNTL